MKVDTAWSRSYDFACHSKACAPPPAGVGGSTGGGGAMRIRHFDRLDSLGGSYWVGMKKPAKHDPDDFEMVEVTHRYHSRAALNNAIENGTAIKPTFKPITAAQARGDSRPVSHSEFQRLASMGQGQLDAMAAKAAPPAGMNRRWDKIKEESYAQVVKPWGGATINARTGKALPERIEHDMYALTVKAPGMKTVSVKEGATRQEFDAAMDTAKQRYSSLLERDQHYLGVFHDNDNKRIDIDPVIVVRDRALVDTIGAASHAIGGAYNFKDGNGYWPPHVAEN